MNITFQISRSTARRLAGVLQSVEAPRGSIQQILREHVEGLCDADGAVFIAESAVYPKRLVAERVAARLFFRFKGQDAFQLSYRRRRRVVCEAFRNPAQNSRAA